MKIRVRQEHIDKGVCNSPWECPIALAAQEAIGTDELSVWPYLLTWCAGELVHEADMPRPAREFIENFDDGRPVEPFEFEIEVKP